METRPIRVLVPLDGSPKAEDILSVLADLRKRMPLQMTLFQSVVPDRNGDPRKEAEAKRYLTSIRERLGKEGIPADIKVDWGYPVTEIHYLEKSSGFDLIAMTSPVRSRLKRATFGSVAKELLRCSERPFLVSRPGVKAADWTRMVVPLDGSALAERILPGAVRLAKALGAEIRLLNVIPSAVAQMTGLGHGGLVPAVDPLPYLRELGERLAQEGVRALPMVGRGDPAAEICRAAKDLNAGAISIATHGRTGLKRVLLGSVAENVLRAASCPVYVLRTAGSPVLTRTEAAKV
jgi:nucleotide-binding universal stress UspA family protein